MGRLKRSFKTAATILSVLVLSVAGTLLTKAVIVHANPTYTLSGVLTDSSSSPVPGILVTIKAADGATASAVTGSDGSYNIVAAADTYYMTLNNYNGTTYATVGNLQSLILKQDSSSPSIDLTTGDVVENLQLKTATVHVYVKDASSNLVSGASVTANDGIGEGSTSLYSGDPGETTDTVANYGGTTNSSGEVDMTTIVGTEYGVTGPGGSSNICANIYGDNVCLTSATTITGDTDITLQQPATTHTLSGTLTDSSGSPLSGELVKLNSSDGNSGSAVTASDGSYRMSMPPDTYYMALNNYNGTTYASVGNLQALILNQSSSSPSIDLTTGDVTQNLQLKTATLHVYVEDASGTPVSGSPVSASDPIGEGSTSLYTGDPGETTSVVADESGTTNSSGEVDMTSIVGAEYDVSSPGGSSNICATISGSNYCLSSATTVTGDMNITVRQTAAPAFTSPNTATTSRRAPYDQMINVTGYPAPTITESGTLPPGLTFTDHGNGYASLDGMDTSSTYGTYPITFTADNGIGSPVTQSFTLTVTSNASKPTFVGASSVTETVNQPFSYSVTASGWPIPGLSAISGLPSGVTFTDNGDGTATISSTSGISTTGNYYVSLYTSNHIGSASESFLIQVGS